MGVFAKDPNKEEQQPGGGSGLQMDLDERACPRCRRMLHPWEDVCPDDGADGVDRTSLPRTDLPPPPAHLLAEDTGDAPDTGDARDAGDAPDTGDDRDTDDASDG